VNVSRYKGDVVTVLGLLALAGLWVADKDRLATGSIAVFVALLLSLRLLRKRYQIGATVMSTGLLALVTGLSSIILAFKCVQQFFLPDGAQAVAVVGLILAGVLGSFCSLFVVAMIRLSRLEPAEVRRSADD
jgi:hypothetical protein